MNKAEHDRDIARAVHGLIRAAMIALNEAEQNCGCLEWTNESSAIARNLTEARTDAFKALRASAAVAGIELKESLDILLPDD